VKTNTASNGLRFMTSFATSVMSHSKRRIEAFELDTGFVRGVYKYGIHLTLGLAEVRFMLRF